MFDRFGNFNSAEEINETAVNLRREKDIESIRVLAEENGIDIEIAKAFVDGDILYLCDEMIAAIGKIDIEAAELKPVDIMEDWVNYIKGQCFEDIKMAKAVRKADKSLKGCIAALLKWSFGHQNPVDRDILKAAGVNAGRCTLGIPGIGNAKKIITDYYLK